MSTIQHSTYYTTKAKREASKSQMRTHKTGAVIVTPAAYDFSGYSHYSTMHTTSRSVHAEMHAIAKAARAHVSTEGATLYVCTIVVKSGNLGVARPCALCAKLIQTAGIEYVVYTTRDGLVNEWAGDL